MSLGGEQSGGYGGYGQEQSSGGGSSPEGNSPGGNSGGGADFLEVDDTPF